jgi:hypothetical protein
MQRLKTPFTARLGSSGIITFQGTASEQVVHWSIIGMTPEGDTIPPLGDLKYEYSKTGKHRCAINVYTAPESEPEIDGSYDKVTARCVLA